MHNSRVDLYSSNHITLEVAETKEKAGHRNIVSAEVQQEPFLCFCTVVGLLEVVNTGMFHSSLSAAVQLLKA